MCWHQTSQLTHFPTRALHSQQNEAPASTTVQVVPDKTLRKSPGLTPRHAWWPELYQMAAVPTVWNLECSQVHAVAERLTIATPSQRRGQSFLNYPVAVTHHTIDSREPASPRLSHLKVVAPSLPLSAPSFRL